MIEVVDARPMNEVGFRDTPGGRNRTTQITVVARGSQPINGEGGGEREGREEEGRGAGRGGEGRGGGEGWMR